MNPHYDTLPPHDLLNESAVLGCILLDPACFDSACSVIKNKPETFYDTRNRSIFAVMERLSQAAVPISTLSIRSEIGDSVPFNYISALPDTAPCPSNLPYHLSKLISSYKQRLTAQICAQALSGSISAPELSAQLTSLLNPQPSQGPLPAKLVMQECIEQLDNLHNGKTAGISTGFPTIDKQGGLFPGEMCLVTGVTGSGKSTLALNILYHALKSFPCAIFSLEMSRTAFFNRLISLDLQIDRRAFRSKSFLDPSTLSLIASNAPRLMKLPLYICDDPSLSAHSLSALIKSLSALNVKLVVIDYAQLVSPSNPSDSREQQVAAIGRSIRAVCQETSITALVLTQLNDEGRVRESRALLHEAHLAIKIETSHDNSTSVSCEKGRDILFKKFPVNFSELTCKITEQSLQPAPRLPYPTHS